METTAQQEGVSVEREYRDAVRVCLDNLTEIRGGLVGIFGTVNPDCSHFFQYQRLAVQLELITGFYNSCGGLVSYNVTREQDREIGRVLKELNELFGSPKNPFLFMYPSVAPAGSMGPEPKIDLDERMRRQGILTRIGLAFFRGMVPPIAF